MIACNCKKSNCLKLYCKCFQHSRYCDGCRCIDCSNTNEHNDRRTSAINAITLRNPNAFNKDNNHDGNNILMSKGCNCIKSHCLKKYCECFSNHVTCSSLCHCQGCFNTTTTTTPNAIDTNVLITHATDNHAAGTNAIITHTADTNATDIDTADAFITSTQAADTHTTEVKIAIDNIVLDHDITNIPEMSFTYLA